MNQADVIRSQIAVANKLENETSGLANAISQTARENGRPMSKSDLKKVIDLTRNTLDSVPTYIEASRNATKGTVFDRLNQELVERLVAYWRKEDDVIPDRHGLIGILDDAYCSLASLEKMSQMYAEKTGKPFTDDNIGEALGSLRVLLGQNHVSQLDALVAADMRSDPWTDLLGTLLSQLTHMPMPQPAHPVWGNMSTNDIVNHRMALLRR